MINYGLSFFETMLRQNSATAEDICKKRWNFIATAKAKRILDYGSGVGWFRAFRPDDDLIVDTYDIANYPQTGINEQEYDVVCFWDSLEHIPDLDGIGWLLKRTKFVAITVPIFPSHGKELLEHWKHYKPGEHLHYFTLELLDNFFKNYNLKRVIANQNECPPREDIWSILYKRKSKLHVEKYGVQITDFVKNHIHPAIER
jgi:hypothetical protein